MQFGKGNSSRSPGPGNPTTPRRLGGVRRADHQSRRGAPAAGEGLLREALTSLYSLFAATRDILRRHGPSIAEPKPDGQYNFGYLSVAMLNAVIRPVLARWHPLLDEWENTRPSERSRVEHERQWPQDKQLRAELDRARATLASYASLLATACGVPDLSAAIPKPADAGLE